MIVYVITKGKYSGYHIFGVADTPAKAQKMVEFYSDKYDKANVEKIDTDELADIFDKGYNIYGCDYYEGDEDVYATLLTDAWDREYMHPLLKKWGARGGKQRYHCDVIAKDEEHAKKIFRDKFAEYRYRTEVEKN